MSITGGEKVLAVTVLGLLILLGIRECSNKKNTDNLISDIANYKSEAKHYTDKYGEVIASNNALTLQSQNQMKTLLASNDTLKAWVDKFRDIKFGGIIKETVTIKEVVVPFETKIPCDFKPFPANKLTKEYKFYSTIANTGLTIDSLFIPNELRIIVGEKKTGFLNMRSELTVEVKNSNKLMTVSDITGYSYKPKQKRFGIGFSVGYGASVRQSQVFLNPYIGASLNYNIITF